MNQDRRGAEATFDQQLAQKRRQQWNMAVLLGANEQSQGADHLNAEGRGTISRRYLIQKHGVRLDCKRECQCLRFASIQSWIGRDLSRIPFTWVIWHIVGKVRPANLPEVAANRVNSRDTASGTCTEPNRAENNPS